MVNGYANLPQEIIDMIPNLPEETAGNYTVRITDSELCDKVHHIFTLGKPIFVRCTGPLDVKLMGIMVALTLGNSESYQDTAAISYGTFTFSLSNVSTPTEGPDGEVVYDKTLIITFNIDV